MSQINVASLSFAYEGSFENVFDNVSFSIDTDWKLGFIGRNGRGKTTFLKLLLGELDYSGVITASVDFEYFPFTVSDDTMSCIEIAENYLPDFEAWRLYREISLLELDDDVLYRPFYTLSQGEQTKLLLAVLFLKNNSFLLIDEPTNHLDTHARHILADYLKKKNGFILVSHDRVFLDSVIDHVLSINRANIQVMRGNFSTWNLEKEREDKAEIEKNAKLKKDVKRLEAAAKKNAQWSERAEKDKIGFDPTKKEKAMGTRAFMGEKSRKLMKRSKVIEQRRNTALEEKSGLMKNLESDDTALKLKILKSPSPVLIEARDLSVDYGNGEVFANLSFEVKRGDRVALRGRNGSGKSSLIKLILGEDIPHSGILRLASGLKISYVPQGTDNMSGTLEDYAYQKGIDLSLFLAILRKLDFKRTQFEKRIESFSEGQKKKVLIASSLCEEAHLFIWDESLNYIDVLSRMQIEELLKAENVTLLFVEHDEAFTNGVSTKQLDFGEI